MDKNKPSSYYLILPSGNDEDWPRFKYWVRKLKLKVYWTHMVFDGKVSLSRVYRVSKKEYRKLPMSTIKGEGRYLPLSADDGFDMHINNDDWINSELTDNKWRRV